MHCSGAVPGLPASGSTTPSVSSATRFLFNSGLESPGTVDAGDDEASMTVAAAEAGEAAEASGCVGDNGGVTFQNMELCDMDQSKPCWRACPTNLEPKPGKYVVLKRLRRVPCPSD